VRWFPYQLGHGSSCNGEIDPYFRCRSYDGLCVLFRVRILRSVRRQTCQLSGEQRSGREGRRSSRGDRGKSRRRVEIGFKQINFLSLCYLRYQIKTFHSPPLSSKMSQLKKLSFFLILSVTFNMTFLRSGASNGTSPYSIVGRASSPSVSTTSRLREKAINPSRPTSLAIE